MSSRRGDTDDSITVSVRYRAESQGTDIALSSLMLNRLTANIGKWLFPAASVSRTITIRGGTLTAETGTSRRMSLSIHRLRVPVPGKQSYCVQFKVADHGEFKVERGGHGGVVLRNRYAGSCTIPACWIPERFLGKTVDRYIVQIDERKVHHKTGCSEGRRPGRADGFSCRLCMHKAAVP